MRILVSIAISLAVLSGSSGFRAEQSSVTSSQEAAGSITGRVTIDNEATPEITVVLQQATGSRPLPPPTARATTDKEGRFKLTNVAAGRYYVIPLAAAYFSPSEDRVAPGKAVTLLNGENLEGVELKLIPGGVITGRVTTAGGYPVIGREIYPRLTDLRVLQLLPSVSNGEPRFKTDDRGIYRIFGLPAGRYLVSLRSEGHGSTEIFHPNAIERIRASPIEVIAGKAVENVDIKLPPISANLAYEISGRVVDESTGQPIPGVKVARTLLGVGSWGNFSVNERGEFSFPNLPPGRHSVYVPIDSLSEYYSDSVDFEVIDKDVAGLEIKARRAGSLSGKVIIEGTRDPAVLANLSHLRISVFPLAGGMGTGVEVSADGRFRIPGLPPDKFRISPWSKTHRQKISLLGIERDGVWRSDGIEVAAGEQVTGLRIIVAYGDGLVRGQAQVLGGSLPEGARLSVSARRADVSGRPESGSSGSVDARGLFLLEGLATGVHEITLTVYAPSQSGATMPFRRWASVKQTVSVTSGAESQVTLVLDVSAINAKEEKR